MEAQSDAPHQPSNWLTALAALGVGSFLACTLLLVTQSQPRKSERGILESRHNIKNLTLAVHNSAVEHAGQLPRTVQDPVPQSWRTQVLKYVDRSDLQSAYRANQAWDAGTNAELARQYLRVFDSPDGQRGMNLGQEWAPSDYGMISGPGTVQPGDRAVTLDEITAGDGLGSTLLLGECIGLQLGWAEPRDPHIDREQMGIEILKRPDQKSNFLLSTCSDWVPVSFADGAVRALNPKIDPKVLKALCTIDGDEPITQKDYID